MARYGRVNVLPRILLLFLLVVVLLLGGLIWFDILGLVDARPVLGPVMNLLGLTPEETTIPDFSDVELLDSMGVQKRELAIALHLQDLERNREQLSVDLQGYEEQLAQLEEREKIQTDRENSFNERVNRYDDRRAGLVQNAKDLTSMRPDDAVAILNQYDDQLLIDTLRVVQELADQEGSFSLVSTYLALLPEDRAATIQRKMTQKPSLNDISDS
jgi:flagellar protein FlbB